MLCKKKYYAPNGKESILYNDLLEKYGPSEAERIYLYTFTQGFKSKFGDWEIVANALHMQSKGIRLEEDAFKKVLDASSNLSKVVDENGQPKVVFHGTEHHILSENFNENTHFGTLQAAKNRGFLKSVDYEEAGREFNWRIYPAFLDIKRIKKTGDAGDSFWTQEINSAKAAEYEGIEYENTSEFDTSYIAFNPSSVIRPPLVKAQKSIKTAGEIEKNFTISHSNSKFIPNVHEYYFEDEKLTSVSRTIDKVVPFNGPATGDQETRYTDAGKRYHLFVEDIINGNAKNVQELAGLHNASDIEKAFMIQAFAVIKRIKAKGGRLLSEIRVANVEKGIAGTIDIIHIKDNGTIDIYDLKTVNETESLKRRIAEGKHSNNIWNIHMDDSYKARRYSHQLALYKTLAELDDIATERKGVPVENVYVIPIAINRDENGEVEALTMLQPENLQEGEWVKNAAHFDIASNYANKLFEDDIAVPISPPDETDSVDSFIENLLPEDKQDVIENAAVRTVEMNINEPGFKIYGSSYTWNSNNFNERVAQVVNEMNNQDEKIGEVVRSLAFSYNNNNKSDEYQKMLKENKQAASVINNILNQVDTKRAYSLSDIPGFEKFSDIMMIEKRDGSYSVVQFTRDVLGKEIKPETNNVNLLTKGIKKIRDKVNSHKNSNILINFVNDWEASHLNITLKNTVGDKKRLRLAMIGSMIQKTNPDFRVSDFAVVSLRAEESTLANTTDDINEQIQKIVKHPSVEGIIPKELIDTVINHPVKASDNGKRLLKFLKSLPESKFKYEDTGTPNARFYIKETLEKYYQGEIEDNQAVEDLMYSERGLFNLLESNAYDKEGNIDYKTIQENVLKDPEYQLYAFTLVQLQGETITFDKDLGDQFLGDIQKYLVSPAYTGRHNLDVATDYIRKHWDRIKRRAQDFNAIKNPLFRQLSKEQGFTKNSSDYLTGMGQSVFQSFLQTKEDAKGRTYYTGYLIDEEVAFKEKKITDIERKTIKFIKDNIKKYYEDAVNPANTKDSERKTWPEGFVPIIRKSPNTLMFEAKKALMNMDPSEVGNKTKDALGRAFDIQGNYGIFSDAAGSKNKRIKDKTQLEDYFKFQITSDGGVSNRALERIGLNEKGELLNTDAAFLANQDFETDLEEVLNQMVLWSLKKQEMEKALPGYRIFKSIFTAQEALYDHGQTDSKALLDNFVNDLLYNEKIDDDSFLSKVISTGVSISSIMLLGFNLKVITANGLQVSMNSMINAISNEFSGNDRFPGLSKWREAFAIISKATWDKRTATKLDLLMQAYMPEDINQIFDQNVAMPNRSGVVKGKETQKGLANPRIAFIFDRMLDYGARMHTLVAQMLVDETWDAHDVEAVENAKLGTYEWQLKYDSKKDPRDTKLLETIKRELIKDKEMDRDAEMSLAYDWRLRQLYKGYADRITGSFDKDKKPDYTRVALLSAFGQFRGWFRELYQRSTTPQYQHKLWGNYEMDQDGEYAWKEGTMKGMLHTLFDIGYIIQKFREDVTEKGPKAAWEDIPQVDKDNLAYALNSAATIGVMSIAVAQLAAQALEDKDRYDKVRGHISFWSDIFTRAVTDAASPFTLSPLFSAGFDNPIVFLSYAERLMQTIYKTIELSVVDGEPEKALEKFVTIIPVIKETVKD